MNNTVLVIGGGVAGIAASVSLAESGFKVTLLEKRPFLGGRASSFRDAESGELMDECQHGTMRCCTNLANLLERLGVHELIRYHNELNFLDGDGVRSIIYGSGLPAPMHTGFSFLTFGSLTIADKIGIGRALLAMLVSKPNPTWDAMSLAEWFRTHPQTPQSIRRFWRPILVSACNDELENISCTHAFKIFRDGFLSHPQAFHFGIPRVPLATLYHRPTVDFLGMRDGKVRIKTTVDKVEFDEEGSISGVVLQNGERLTADYYISALQFDLLLKLLPTEITVGSTYWENMAKIELSPLMGIHLWFDRPLNLPPALAILDRRIEWIFYKNANFDMPSDSPAYLSIVISASRIYSGIPPSEIVDMAMEDLHACLPKIKEANLVRSRVIRWSKATMSPKSGIESLRPSQRSPIPNLFVAGEWTQTGWPSTMEGAARSGYLAAEALLESMGQPKQILAPDLPVNPLLRFLMGKSK